jgi:hypothetical protein
MISNKFSLVVSLLQAGAAVEASLSGNYKLAALWICYSIASAVMAFM